MQITIKNDILYNGDGMAKRRISKASKRRLSFFGTISVIAIIYFIFSILYNAYTIYDLSIEKNNLEKEYVNLQEQAEKLKTDIEKLGDPEYLANYARENYGYSKEGEYKIQIDEMEKTSDSINVLSKQINRNYVITALIIFIYIILKGKKGKKKKK